MKNLEVKKVKTIKEILGENKLDQIIKDSLKKIK